MWDKGLASVDVTDPKDIKLLDKIDLLTSQPTGNLEFYYALAAAAAGDWLYVADAAGFVAVLNAADPANLRYVTYVRFARPWDLAVQGDCLYVADEATGLVALNIASPAKPTQAGKLAVPTGQWMNLAVQGSMLVVGEPTGMTYVGVSTPSSMAVTGRFTDPQSGGRATFHGSDVVLPLQADGLLVADASSLLEATVITRSGTVVLGGGLTATISISGGGIVRATVGDGGGAIGLLEVYYGGTRSSVTIRSSGGPTPVQDVIVYGSLGKLTGTRCQLLGDMTVGGLLGTLAWGDVADNHTIDINADGLAVGTRDAVTVALGRVADADLDTHGLPVKGLTVTEWVDGDDDGSAGSITAPWIGKIMAKGLAGRGAVVPIPGDLACDLVLTGADAKGNTLGSAKVAGQIGGTWDLTAAGAGDVGTVSAKLGTDAGWVLDAPHSTVKSADAGTGTLAGTCTVLTIGKVSTKGDLTADITALGADARKGVSIGSLSAAAARGARVVAAGEISKIMLRESHGSDFLAGVRTELIAPDQRYAEAAGDFADVLGTPPALRGIKLLKISGQKAAAGDPTRFLADSNFSAPVFGAVQLANAAEGDAYGLHVLDDPLSDNPRIKSISYKDTLNPPGSSSWRPGQATPAIGGFCVTEVA